MKAILDNQGSGQNNHSIIYMLTIKIVKHSS